MEDAGAAKSADEVAVDCPVFFVLTVRYCCRENLLKSVRWSPAPGREAQYLRGGRHEAGARVPGRAPDRYPARGGTKWRRKTRAASTSGRRIPRAGPRRRAMSFRYRRAGSTADRNDLRGFAAGLPTMFAAPAGAPNVLIILLDDVGFGHPKHVRRPGRDEGAAAPRRRGRALQPLPHDRAAALRPARPC